jgi:hypothetical protein
MNELEKDFVPYQEALALKELGFDEPCLGFYDGKGSTQLYFNNKRDASGDFIPFVKSERLTWFGTPTFSQAFRWFREKHGWQHSIDATSDQHSFELGYNYWIWNYKTGEEYYTMPKNRPSGDWEYKTYEEAELECLRKLIEIVKEK